MLHRGHEPSCRSWESLRLKFLSDLVELFDIESAFTSVVFTAAKFYESWLNRIEP